MANVAKHLGKSIYRASASLENRIVRLTGIILVLISALWILQGIGIVGGTS